VEEGGADILIALVRIEAGWLGGNGKVGGETLNNKPNGKKGDSKKPPGKRPLFRRTRRLL
jgi:hypothetical protein